MTTTPILTGRDIALAHYATRAALETLLTDLGITFEQSVQLVALDDNGGAINRDQLVRRLVDGLKIDTDEANNKVDSLIDAGLATASSDAPQTFEFSEFGARIQSQIRAATTRIIDRLYGDLPADDLVVTQRVLATVTERANRELELAGRS
jgi:DNA-binding MarR family transcriptional regulator